MKQKKNRFGSGKRITDQSSVDGDLIAPGNSSMDKRRNSSSSRSSSTQESKELTESLASVHTSDMHQSNIHERIDGDDNPFLDQDDESFKSTRANTSATKLTDVVNPNAEYKDNDSDNDEEILTATAPDTSITEGIVSTEADGGNDVVTASVEDKEGTVTDTAVGLDNANNTVDQKVKESIIPDIKLINDRVQILEANKVSEGQGRAYVAYTIKWGDQSVRRRYSDFESLRSVLMKLFPTSLLPPIPEKQTLKNYSKSIAGSKSNYLLPSEGTGSVDLVLSVINGTVTNNDEKLIRHRIRMLTSFLNKLLQDEEILKTPIIYDFLDPNNINWNDFINSSATFSMLPKSVLQCNPLDPTNTTRIHACLPVPSTSHILPSKEKVSDTKTIERKDGFDIIEQEHKQYESLLKSGFYKHNTQITKSLYGMQHDMKDLSDTFAHFASAQACEAELAEQLTYMSNAYDDAASNLEALVGLLYYNINEPLGESVRMAGSAKELIKYRKLKGVQLEILINSLESKRQQLHKLELQRGVQPRNGNTASGASGNDESSVKKPQASKSQSSSYGGKFLNRFNKIAAMVKETINYQEQDPQTTMANLIKEIEQLNESEQVARHDLEDISKIIKEDRLTKFSEEREKELNEILRNYSKYLKDYAKKNLELWKEIKTRQEQL
ncbi:hypothetical protein Kpol_1043p28 [Vanderwaltozyma polyspora DSM 70294]|uniref:Autophagy-related protein 20 n=1 Tax=Vanderwaltozyma polyspora (strain ATCC 22028 / DSM 70294 / BCRC 21397 / CBS 2163 / NBRC 10782 / NRRL Y-8283 / UCD 57-17) TaxID=436907 RepID=ATG20_VANPO|nr:uncharacterized protein Kpol_1043p28 [Vanderwaltozyma polyspora DSM 70294]A7TIP6.1 RecName: Full=Autophagy-related protein 20 [Vanderwaltozyma polyspora DSM 70294]EDO17838.1 hypothetical protein Kpol_1043p28 [Vanderwaltozyma polyspora DSM 70294]